MRTITTICITLILFLALVPLLAADTLVLTAQVEIAAPSQTLVDTPMQTRLELPPLGVMSFMDPDIGVVKTGHRPLPADWLQGPLTAVLTLPEGATIQAQARVRERRGQMELQLLWIQPSLTAGATHALALSVQHSARQPAGLAIEQATDSLLVSEQGRPVCQWMTAWDPADLETTKKVYTHFWNPAGDTLLTKGPGGLYPHHRGLMIGWGKTTVGPTTWNSWVMEDNRNTQRLQKFTDLWSGPVAARQCADITWNSPSGDTYILEYRTHICWAARHGCRLVDAEFYLEGATAEVLLDGDPHHGGAQFRAAQAVADSTTTTRFFHADPADPLKVLEVPPQDESVVGKRTAWQAMTFPLGGQTRCVMLMENPGNPEPSQASVRYYGRFGWFFPTKVSPSQPLELDYRLALFDTVPDQETMVALWQAYANAPAADVAACTWQE